MDEHSTQAREQGSVPLSLQEETHILNEEHTKFTTTQERLSTIDHLRQQVQKQIAAQNWQQAGESYARLLQLEPQDEEALVGVAMVLDRMNHFEPLYKAAQQILAYKPDSAVGLAYKARALQKLERLSEATIANDQALLLNTNLGLAWINRSGLQLVQGKFPEALRSAQRAVELAPDDPRAWANYGVSLTNFNRLSEALESFDESLKRDPQQLFALQMKSDILCRIGRMKEAFPLIQQALSINPDNPVILSQGIQVVRSLEMYQQLKELSAAMIQLLPDNLFAWENYVRSLRGLGEFEEANTALDQLIALSPSNVRFWTMKADTLYRLEHYREASSAAEQAKRINPDYPPAQRIHDKALRLMYQRKGKRI